MPFSPRLCALLTLASSLLPLTAAQAADCHAFESETLTLTGTLYPDTYPGAPGFEDVTQGDEAEVGFYLALPEPLCMTPSADYEVSADDGRLDYLQLILDQKGYDQLRPYLLGEGTLTLKGTIARAETGHHHTPLLLQQVEFVSGTKSAPVDCELLGENASLDEQLPTPLPGAITGNDRLYFHQAPNEACTDKKAYIVQGDRVTVTNLHSFGWAQVSYTTQKGTTFSGWVHQGQVLINSPELKAATLPADVNAFTTQRDDCEHFRGEEPYDAERAAELAQAVEKSCTTLNKQWEQLHERYKNNTAVLDALGEGLPLPE